MSLKFFLILEEPRLHTGKAVALIASFFRLLQTLALWLHRGLGVPRGQMPAIQLPQAVFHKLLVACFRNITSNQTSFSTEVLVGCCWNQTPSRPDRNTPFMHTAMIILVSTGKIHLCLQKQDRCRLGHRNYVL